MGEDMMGEMKLFGGNFVPQDWLPCDGRLLEVSQYQALYSILGTLYGGDGRTTFALPDLRRRTPIGWGQGPELSDHQIGNVGGVEQQGLTVAQLPGHTHSDPAAGAPATDGGGGFTSTTTGVNTGPTGGNTNTDRGGGTTSVAVGGNTGPAGSPGTTDGGGGATSASATGGRTTGVSGEGQPVDRMQPYLALNYIICVEGLYPARS